MVLYQYIPPAQLSQPVFLKVTGSRHRYAPSPTGDLHLGNLRTALLTWLAARRVNGTFILRIEDLDRPRVRPGATQRIIADLRWLGIDWDEGPDNGGPVGPYVQLRRLALYDAALARLHQAGLLYPCYCSRADTRARPSHCPYDGGGRSLDRLASAPAPGEDSPMYPGTCRDLAASERATFEAAGRRPSWRFRVPAGTVRFVDGAAGEQFEDVARAVGDFIVRRADGVVAYQLAVVVDDALMGITEVTRGADLLSSTARQIALFQALGWPVPRYTHVPLLTDSSGAKLAKRDQAAGIAPLRAAGAAPEAIVGQLAASAGIWPSGTPISARDLVTAADWPWR